MNKQIRVLVVDDSAFMRKVLKDILTSDERITVVATARHGKDALNKIKTLKPDVITLDIEMPVMDGLMTLEQIMKNHPLPVIMISSSTTEVAQKTLQAISMGAIDFITKPSGPNSLDIHLLKEEIISKVIMATEANLKKQQKLPNIYDKKRNFKKHNETVIAIGTSTGGPRALQKIITYLPKDIEATFLIVQHMPPGFTRSLADRLNMLANITVKEAEQGDVIKHGIAYIAPGDYHMQVKQSHHKKYIHLTKDHLVNNHRPSVDVLLKSIARLRNTNIVSIILTGMGKDGADGVRTLKKVSPQSIVLAEDEQSAVVYGMPKAAIETNCVDKVITLDHMGSVIEQIIRETRRD